MMTEIDMRTRLGSLALPYPVLAASGCAGYGRELSGFVDLDDLGCLITKSIMTTPRAGRPTPRMAETTGGMLNSIGLQGTGIDHFVAHDLPWLTQQGARTAVSIAATSAADYRKLAGRLRGHDDVLFIEANISCPNVENRDHVFACDPRAAAGVVEAVRAGAGPDLPVFAKLSADVSDIVAVAVACVEAGADGLSLINTLLGAAIDLTRMRPVLPAVTGGLSGPAIRPVAVRCVWQVREALPDIPIIGGGGVFTGLHALEMVLAGANAVSVGTAIFRDPRACVRIRDELTTALAERGITRFTDAVSLAHDRSPADRKGVECVSNFAS